MRILKIATRALLGYMLLQVVLVGFYMLLLMVLVGFYIQAMLFLRQGGTHKKGKYYTPNSIFMQVGPAASGLGPSAEIAIMDHQHLQDSGMPQEGEKKAKLASGAPNMPSLVCVSLNVVHPAMAENRDVNQGRRHYMTRSRARNLAADTAIISTSTGSRFKPVVVVRLWKGLWTRILPLPHYDPLVWLLDVIIGCFLYRLNILLLMFGFYCYNLYMIVSSFE
uniref:Uncharacterized protein n=1 Tax=Populus alba TaxID=43335 RepID=A0A4U5PS39_POPAL|nr:hypothetical protein D5086_0000189470 [Populus alba]